MWVVGTAHGRESEKVRERRRALALPHSLNRILDSSLSALWTHRGSRCWALPETSFDDEVRHYYERHKALGLSGPRPKLRTDVTGRPSPEELAMQVDVALSLLELGAQADPLSKPILLYYSCANIVSAFTRCFFDWEQDRRSHGLSCSHDNDNLPSTCVKIKGKGQMPRLATTCFLLSGMPSCFSELITYSMQPLHHTRAGELLERFGKTEEAEPIRSLTLDELRSFDYPARLKAVRVRHGFHKFNGLPGTALLLDYLMLFAASSLARYDVVGWKKILDGKGNDYRLSFDDVFDRYCAFTVDLFLVLMANPLERLDASLLTNVPSPYSTRHHRFPDDPNYAS